METKTKEQVKLVSMREFVLEQEKIVLQTPYSKEQEKLLAIIDSYESINNYARFLSTPLQLGHFIPCSLDGVVLSEPESWQNFLEYSDISVPGLKPELYEYAEAKSRVLFEGLTAEKGSDYYIVRLGEIPIWASWNESKIIETLIPHNLTLTQTAKEMFNLK